MSHSIVPLTLYWNGTINRGPFGSEFSSPPKRLINVDENITFVAFMRKLYQVTRTTPSQVTLTVYVRYPMTTLSTGVQFQHIPVDDDESLKTMLMIPKLVPCVRSVEVFILSDHTQIEQRPNVGTSADIFGYSSYSYSQLLNSGGVIENLGDPWNQYSSLLRASSPILDSMLTQ